MNLYRKRKKLLKYIILKKNNDINSGKDALDILINEFVEDISSKNLNMRDLKLGLNVINLLEKIDNLLKEE